MANHAHSILNECARAVLACHTFSKDSSPNLLNIGFKGVQKSWIRVIHMDLSQREIDSRPQSKQSDIPANTKDGGSLFGQFA